MQAVNMISAFFIPGVGRLLSKLMFYGLWCGEVTSGTDLLSELLKTILIGEGLISGLYIAILTKRLLFFLTPRSFPPKSKG